jgi:hypothetical protein
MTASKGRGPRGRTKFLMVELNNMNRFILFPIAQQIADIHKVNVTDREGALGHEAISKVFTATLSVHKRLLVTILLWYT